MFQKQKPELDGEVKAIEKVVNAYFKSYLNAESEDLAKVFHPESRLFSVDEDNLGKTELADWLENLRVRRTKGDIRTASSLVAGVDISGDAAIAKATLQFPEFKFVDYLSLLKIRGEWTIINKIYTVVRE